ncbi:MAG TPA: NAD(P)/FAD-dependent oxidoreductase [Anaeromyxobacteraceae bacterium]|nr:NAD(P)/FAD-dependent oxidoreductase [Anaeromyxobacteraceae bacterium]
MGAGFAGLYCARELRGAPVRVTIVDRRNHHLFQPLLYQVATAGLNPADIAVPTRAIFRKHRNVEVLLGEVAGFDLARRRVRLADGAELAYDRLVVATGVTHSYFGKPEWARFAPGLKTVEDAVEIRRRVLVAFERAERATDPPERDALLTFVVVGGGPTGVELAGALVEIARHTLARDFRHIEPASARVILLEGTPRVLPSYPEDLSESARRQLVSLGVEVRTGKLVTGIDGEGVRMGDERIAVRTVLWGAGVAASPLARALGVPLDKAGRVKVSPDLTIPGHPDVFVAGDLAAVAQEDGTTVPGLAPAAIQEGRHVAKAILASLRGAPLPRFRYRDKGSLSTIGRARAVGLVRGLHLTGFVAWFTWLFVHILFLIGFRNRFMVLAQWAWAYLTWGRGARLITDTAERWQYAAAEAGPGAEGEQRAPPPGAPRAVSGKPAAARH